jgi:hypothetical protein
MNYEEILKRLNSPPPKNSRPVRDIDMKHPKKPEQPEENKPTESSK